ncbi:hypothetical protein [Ornithinimicrobium kibberense]|uniref:hypothetical protein n=1 Tax=Ornithinimicrobium kibberense TaxID=282060 RepID=UPI003621654A
MWVWVAAIMTSASAQAASSRNRGRSRWFIDRGRPRMSRLTTATGRSSSQRTTHRAMRGLRGSSVLTERGVVWLPYPAR